VTETGFWGNQTICDMARILEAEEHGIDERLNRYDVEIRAYHRAHDPVRNADIIYERITS
jgi:hypothetical protein